MVSQEQSRSIRYLGGPAISAAGREVFAFHLHRYLSAWLAKVGCPRVMVTLGFSQSQAALGAYRVDVDGGDAVASGWTFGDLEDAWRFGQSQILWDGGDGDPIAFSVLPVFDASGGDPIAFVTLRDDAGLSDGDCEELADLVATAIAMGRRNGVRLFFDEQQDRPVKELLYATMHRLPEWVGCDHSAAVLLTHDLDAMTLDATEGGTFNVLAERLFFVGETEFVGKKGENQSPPDGAYDGDRLVGMAVDAGADSQSYLHQALQVYRRDPSVAYLLYERDDQGQWVRADGDDEQSRAGCGPWHGLADRPEEATVALVPLVHRARGERDLLGFISISWRSRPRLSPGVLQLFGEVAAGLARLLRQSPLYSLSVRKMWVIRRVRDCVEAALAEEERGEAAVEALIGAVNNVVADQVDVPSVAMGYLRGKAGQRVACYVHPRGWTRFDDLELAIDVADDERVDSGVAGLAVRLGRPVVLAGGHGEGADLAFKNHLWVDEGQGQLFDRRSPAYAQTEEEQLRQQARPLREYYKPARESAYASLSYPMLFGGQVVGVLSVEVARHTDWLWWTGFGGHLFWDMVARQMGMAISLLGDQ